MSDTLDKPERRWSWRQFWIAAGLIPLGGVCWYLGIVGGFAEIRWLYRPSMWFTNTGPLVSMAGGLWLLILIVRWLFVGARNV